MLNKRKLIKAVFLQDSMQFILSLPVKYAGYYMRQREWEYSVELMPNLKIRLSDCTMARFLFSIEVKGIAVLELGYNPSHPFWITSKKHFRIPPNMEEYLNFWAEEQLRERKDWKAECKKQEKIEHWEAQKIIDDFTLEDASDIPVDIPFHIGDTVFVSNEKSWVSRTHKSFFGTVIAIETHPNSKTCVTVRFPENGSTVEWTYHSDELSLEEEVLDLTLGEFCCQYGVRLLAEYLPKMEDE